MEKTTLDLSKMIAGTFLAPVFELMASGKYVSPPDIQVAEGETIIGEFTDFEKAVHTYRDQIADTHNEWVRKLVGAPTAEEQAIIAVNHEKSECLNKMLLTSIQCRLGNATWSGDGGLGIRQNYQIVTKPRQENPLNNLLSALLQQEPFLCNGDCENCSEGREDAA